jgi:hypothetical protein
MGIPALNDVAGTGSGDVPGSAECEVYNVIFANGDEDSPTLRPVDGLTPTVYNLSETAVAAGWVLVVRDKFGQWWAVPTAVSSGGGTGGTGTADPCSVINLASQDPLAVNTEATEVVEVQNSSAYFQVKGLRVGSDGEVQTWTNSRFQASGAEGKPFIIRHEYDSSGSVSVGARIYCAGRHDLLVWPGDQVTFIYRCSTASWPDEEGWHASLHRGAQKWADTLAISAGVLTLVQPTEVAYVTGSPLYQILPSWLISGGTDTGVPVTDDLRYVLRVVNANSTSLVINHDNPLASTYETRCYGSHDVWIPPNASVEAVFVKTAGAAGYWEIGHAEFWETTAADTISSSSTTWTLGQADVLTLTRSGTIGVTISEMLDPAPTSSWWAGRMALVTTANVNVLSLAPIPNALNEDLRIPEQSLADPAIPRMLLVFPEDNSYPFAIPLWPAGLGQGGGYCGGFITAGAQTLGGEKTFANVAHFEDDIDAQAHLLMAGGSASKIVVDQSAGALTVDLSDGGALADGLLAFYKAYLQLSSLTSFADEPSGTDLYLWVEETGPGTANAPRVFIRDADGYDYELMVKDDNADDPNWKHGCLPIFSEPRRAFGPSAAGYVGTHPKQNTILYWDDDAEGPLDNDNTNPGIPGNWITLEPPSTSGTFTLKCSNGVLGWV